MGKNRPVPLYRRDNRKDSPMSEKNGNTPAVADALNALLADSFALYLNTKNYHWHVQGPRFRELHLLFDEKAAPIFETTALLAAREIGNASRRERGGQDG